MKAFLIVMACLSSALYAQTQYVVISRPRYLSCQNGVMLQLHAGDCLRFSGRPNAFVFYSVPNVGTGSSPWNEVSVFSETPDFVDRNKNTEERISMEYLFEIPDDINPALSNQSEARGQMTMNRVERMGYYAVLKSQTRIENRSFTANYQQGDAFPFLGFKGESARFALGSMYLTTPKDNVDIVSVFDHPEMKDSYKAQISEYNAYHQRLEDRAQIAEQTEVLRGIQSDLEKIHRQQQLDWLNRH